MRSTMNSPNAAEIDELSLEFLLIDERMVDLSEPLQLVARKKRIFVRRRVIEPREKAEFLLGADLIEKIVGLDSVRRRGDDRAAFVIQ